MTYPLLVFITPATFVDCLLFWCYSSFNDFVSIVGGRFLLFCEWFCWVGIFGFRHPVTLSVMPGAPAVRSMSTFFFLDVPDCPFKTHQVIISVKLGDCIWIFHVLGSCTSYTWWLDCHQGSLNTNISILVPEDVCTGASCPGRFKHWWRSILGRGMAAVATAVLKGDNFKWCPIFFGG